MQAMTTSKQAVGKRPLEWEDVDGTCFWSREMQRHENQFVQRAAIPGGWLLRLIGGDDIVVSITFVPDQNHDWEL